VIKLLAIAKKQGKNLELRVHPTMIPKTHPLASVINEVNAVYFEGDGNITLIGEGAGQAATAANVVSNIMRIAGKLDKEYRPVQFFGNKKYKVAKTNDINAEFYVRFAALDKPGTLAELSKVMGQEKINISQVIQIGKQRGKEVPLVMMTDVANEGSIHKATQKLKKSKKAIPRMIIRAEE